jgi:ABC-type sugar transport system, periplasmic component
MGGLLMKKALILSLVIALVISLGCVAGIAAPKQYTVAFSQSSSQNAWRAALTNDMPFWAKKLDVNYIWADASQDATKQLADCEDLIAKKPDLLIMAPVEEKPLTPVAQMCTNAHIPLITVDRVIGVKAGNGMYISAITADFVETGRKDARSIVAYLKKKNGAAKGNIVEITGQPGASTAVDMSKGFREVIANYPDIKIVASQPGNFAETDGKTVMENFLQAFPAGKIDAVLAQNDPMGKGALFAIKEAKRNELVGAIWAMDGMQFYLKGILDGDYGGTVANPPFYGKIAIQTGLNYLKGMKVSPLIYLEQKLFERSNLDMVRKEYNRQVAENSTF